jgi:hypothetical protein
VGLLFFSYCANYYFKNCAKVIFFLLQLQVPYFEIALFLLEYLEFKLYKQDVDFTICYKKKENSVSVAKEYFSLYDLLTEALIKFGFKWFLLSFSRRLYKVR